MHNQFQPWQQPARPAKRRTAVRTFLKTFVLTFVLGSLTVGGSIATGQTVVQLVQADGSTGSGSAGVAPRGNPAGTPDAQTRVVAEARAICQLMLSYDSSTCQSLPIEFEDLEAGRPAYTVLVFTKGAGKVEAAKIVVDRRVLGEDPGTRRYYLAHEWAHVRLAQVAGTPMKLDSVNMAADELFSKKLPAPLKKGAGGELLTDCMAWDSGTFKGVTPAYVSQLGIHGEADVAAFCAGWQEATLG